MQWDLRTGQLKELTLHAAREPDRSAPVQTAEGTPQSLRLADLGYADARGNANASSADGDTHADSDAGSCDGDASAAVGDPPNQVQV